MVIGVEEWTKSKKTHFAKLSDFITKHIKGRTLGVKHPVYDFLFSYYSFSSGQLLRWSPGINVRLEVSRESKLDWQELYSSDGDTCLLDINLFPDRRVPYLKWAIKYLTLTSERPPVYHCFGLHEWAMLYKGKNKQHPHVPLRVKQEIIDEIVEERPLCCSHYDAFRFFSEEAKPMNKVELQRETVPMHEQPGCIHANMDLYKMGYKIAPFISSELLADLFQLARRAREVDMRASPYDISDYGFRAIPIETKDGREEYVEEQKRLFQDGQMLRVRLIKCYQSLLSAKQEGNYA